MSMLNLFGAMKNLNESKMLDKNAAKTVTSAIPKKRQDLLKWHGWGYKDSKFYPVVRQGSEEVCFSGSRYSVGGDIVLPYFGDYIRKHFKLKCKDMGTPPHEPTEFPEPILNKEFVGEIKSSIIDYSVEGMDRLIRCHGQTVFDIIKLRRHLFKRIPDIVLYPENHEHVAQIVNLANEFNVVLIPFGGGTSVSAAVTCPQDELRSIAVVDTSQMNKLLWLDKSNLVACFESGIVGQDLERVLEEEGLTMGHQPDSSEFSTLGGWVATRASGMKKNLYGNIEELVIRVKMVTSKGTLERNTLAPRVSCGPNFDHLVLGSEGMLGIITEVVVKVRHRPEIKRFGSLVFPNFDSGIKFLREIAKKRCQPASIRLMDNEQFKFGQALRPDDGNISNFIDAIKMFLLTKVKGYNLDHIAVATLLFEGESKEVKCQEKKIYDIAKQCNGINAGAKNGQKGYVLTYVIAYIRDFALSADLLAESFETSISWDRCESLCNNVKLAVHNECKKLGIIHYLISCRVTQTYDAGACVYFYFGFRNISDKDSIETYEHIERIAREEILASGGSISHHHGIGKIRSHWYMQSVSDVGVEIFKNTKLQLDPKNIFALGNLLPADEYKNLYKIKSKL